MALLDINDVKNCIIHYLLLETIDSPKQPIGIQTLLNGLLLVRSFGVGIPGTRNVYIFVPSIPR